MTTTRASIVLRHLRGLAAAERGEQVTDRQLLERFALRREETAFAALVRRHGPVVWGVCRRVLRNHHDAEDAFQATFLVLAQKAGSVGRQGSVGGWLHRVAYHAALKARARAANRERHERQAVMPHSSDLLAEVTGQELLMALDEELARVPEKYRAPLVLCYLEGKTCDEAARQLRCSPSTLKRRLERGRARLRCRLERRGLALPAALLAAGLTAGATRAAVPAALAGAAVKAALDGVTGHGLTGTAPATRLAGGVLRSMTAARLKAAAVALFTAVILALGALTLTQLAQSSRSEAGAPAAPQEQARPAPKPVADEDQETMTVAGRVLDIQGSPVAGAEVAVVARGWNFAAKEYQVLKTATTDGDGRFRLSTLRPTAGEGFLLAGKRGFALGQQQLNDQADRQETTFVLAPEQPLRGRLFDLQGQPAAGIKVAVWRVGTRDDVSLFAPPERLPLWPAPATSEADGRFTIAGLARNKEVTLLVQDDRFGWQPLALPPNNGDREKAWVLSPARLLEGKVVYEDTGAPAANCRVVVGPAAIVARADKSGRFKVNMPAVEARDAPPLLVYPAEGEPYLGAWQEVAWPRGATRHEIEVKLPRGVLVRGKVTEAKSGRPVAGAGVQFVPREADNPNLRPHVLTGHQGLVASGTDGSFQLAVLPGPGHLLVSGPGRGFVHEEVGDRVLLSGKPGGARLYPDGLVKLDLAPKAEPKDVTVALRRGVTVRGRLLDPEGKPVARAQMVCRLHKTAVPSLFEVEVRGGRFALPGCDPDKDYPVYFLDWENGWGATVTLSGKQAGGDPVTVQLAPCGKAVVRFVDADGKPLKDHPIQKPVILKMVVTPGPTCEQADDKGQLEADQVFADNLMSRKDRVARKQLKTDAEGRCTYAGLIPGATYRLSVWDADAGLVLKQEFRAEAGKTLDQGDLQLPAR
jgi:RNA polymerase sigma factor (sigma-70 family)